MNMRRFLPVAVAAVLPAALLVVGAAPPSSADYVPAPFSGTAHGDIATVSVSHGQVASLLPGSPLVGVAVAHSRASADSGATPRTYAESANVHAAVAGVLAQDRVSASAPPPSSYGRDLASVSLAPLLSTGLLHGSGEANWAGDAACVPAGTPLSRANTTLASATVGQLTVPLSQLTGLNLSDLTVDLASLGAASTTSTTRLAANVADPTTNDLVSTSSATIATTSLLNGDVTLDLASPITLTARSTGSSGTITYSDPTVTATVGGSTTNVAAGATVTLPPVLMAGTTSAPLLVGQVSVAVAADPSTTTGATASAAVDAVATLTVTLSAQGALATLLDTTNLTGTTETLASSTVALLPLAVAATAPSGGVQCTLPPPVVVSPADGAWTTPTPTLTGTGVAGSTVTVTVDGTVIGTAVVAGDGSWSVPWPSGRPPLSAGAHTVSATQALDGLTSTPSGTNTFHVAAPPLITAPANGSTTSDTTPSIEGTGQPGATVEVMVDGIHVGPATVDSSGHWSLTVTGPLSYGAHVVDATQTDAGGNMQSAPQVHFTVAPTVPSITSPAEGSSTSDRTPDITGTAIPGATVTVHVDGAQVGTTPVDATGHWTLQLSKDLSCDKHVATATATAGGATSPASQPVHFEVTCAAGGGTPAGGGTVPTSGGLAEAGAPADVQWLTLLGMLLIGSGAFILRRRLS